MEEEWKPLPGYEGIYEISNTGQVRSLDRVTIRNHRGKVVTQPVKGRLMTLTPTKHGHQTVNLCMDGVPSTKYVHELVAATFIGQRPEGMQICHGDGVGNNNATGNLRYDTPVGNAADRHIHGTDARGINNPGNKYSEELIRQVKTDMATKSNAELSEKYNIPRSTISAIRTGKIWSFLGT